MKRELRIWNHDFRIWEEDWVNPNFSLLSCFYHTFPYNIQNSFFFHMKNNILFTIFTIIVSIFVIAFGMTTYRYYQAIHSDDPINPYLAVEKWNATIARGEVAIDMNTPETYGVREWDIIIIHEDSQALIAWPDHSTTRLGANSRLIIERMRVAEDYSKIELVATLENGKVWSNIVRTLYPDSRIEFRLPKSGTVAWVRGTVFEINLDANYIRSLNHSISLKNSFGSVVTLMSGEAVRANNIFEKISTGFDTAWISINQSKDAIYMNARDAKLRGTYMLLAGKSSVLEFWDRFVRWVLSWFSAFRDIEIIRAISSWDVSYIMNIPQNAVMKWYQTFQGPEFVMERDQIRGIIMTMKDTFLNGDKIIESLVSWAMWDTMSSSGITLVNAQWLLENYAQKTGITLDMLNQKLNNLDINTITSEWRSLYQKMVE